jgi:hypothetical protein
VKLVRSDPAGTVTLAGIDATDVFALCSVTMAPPAGAAPLRTTIPVEDWPPVTSSGLRKNEVTRVAPGVAFTVSSRITVDRGLRIHRCPVGRSPDNR